MEVASGKWALQKRLDLNQRTTIYRAIVESVEKVYKIIMVVQYHKYQQRINADLEI